MRLGDISASPRILPLTASSVLDATAIKTSIATSASAVTYTGNALNGSDVDAEYVAKPAPSGLTNVAQYPIAVASNSAGSYVASSKITFTGTYGGRAVVRTATVVGTGGNATFIADGPMNTVTSITVAAQANTSGAWTFGWNDIACKQVGGADEPFRIIRPTSTGNLVVTCGSGDDATIDLISGGPDEILYTTRLKFSSTSTTITTVKVYE